MKCVDLISCLGILLIYMLLLFCFWFPAIRLYIILCHSVIFVLMPSKSAVRKRNNNSLSTTTHTLSLVFLFCFSHFTCSKSGYIHYWLTVLSVETLFLFSLPSRPHSFTLYTININLAAFIPFHNSRFWKFSVE